MKVSDLMSKDPACCQQDTSLQEVARLMVEHDCGLIPVTDSQEQRMLVGVITDRDIVCRALARGCNPMELSVGQCMSSPVITVGMDTSLDDCCKIMENHQVRRIPVVDRDQNCCGIIAQADIAQKGPEHEIAEVLREVSQPSGGASMIDFAPRC